MSRTVVFIHGAWMTPACWERFTGRYEARGWAVLAPPWPLEDRPIDELRAQPDPALAAIGVSEIVDHYAAVIAALPEPPLLVGHSFGGLFVQMLLDRGLGAAGVAIDPAPPRWVLATPKAICGSLSVLLTPFGWRKTLRMSFDAFSKTFANRVPADQQRAEYDRHIVPTPGRIFFQDAVGKGTGVRFNNPSRAPLLITAASDDLTVDPAMVRANFRKYRGAALTDFHEFSGHSHFLIAEPGWGEVADYTLDWAEMHIPA